MLISVSTLSFGQVETQKDTATTWQLLKYDANSTLKGLGHTFTRPLHWKGKDFLKHGGLAVGSLMV